VNVLLDTHTLLWHYLNDPRLSAAARTTIADPANRVFVSPASHWEVAIKLSAGKDTLHVPFLDIRIAGVKGKEPIHE